MSARVRPARRNLVAFTLSVVLHPLVAGGLLLLSQLGPKRPPRVEKNPISMRTINPRQWSANRGRSAPQLETPAPLHPKGQIVDVAPGNDRVPVESKYLAETNNRVEKQTRAREQSQKWSVATAKNSPKPEAMPVARGRAGGGTPTPVTAASRVTEPDGLLGPRPSLSQLFQDSMKGAGKTGAPSEDKQGEAASAGDEARGVDSNTPSTGGAAPNDNLNDVPAGDGTFLNTREWKYAAFFNRVKQAVSAHWKPNDRLGNKGAGYTDRNTVMQVALRPDGTIADLFVAKSSGLEALDQEAMAAFEKAAPFMNPPAALVEQGFIRFQFGFTVTNESMSVPRMLMPGRSY